MTVSDIEAFAQQLAETAAAKVNGHVAVIIWTDGQPTPFGYIVSNPIGHAAMAHCLLQVGVRQERLTDCEACTDAWARMKMALAALEPSSGEEARH